MYFSQSTYTVHLRIDSIDLEDHTLHQQTRASHGWPLEDPSEISVGFPGCGQGVCISHWEQISSTQVPAFSLLFR